ncbi:MAG: HAD-IIIA family hydrolase [Pseudomonadales bacterium]|nr:HAD-IIIA family hydrolase [Pseudomonadales bacterium]
MQFNLEPSEVLERAKAVRLLLLDVDGVLTNGSLCYTESGEAMKMFNTQDGLGIKLLQENGIKVGIISGRQSTALARRVAELGITLFYQGREDKLSALQELCSEHNYVSTEIAYAGDDLPDIPILRSVCLGFTVPDGHSSVKTYAHAETNCQGGEGAVREIADFLLQAQERYDAAIARFL